MRCAWCVRGVRVVCAWCVRGVCVVCAWCVITARGAAWRMHGTCCGILWRLHMHGTYCGACIPWSSESAVQSSEQCVTKRSGTAERPST